MRKAFLISFLWLVLLFAVRAETLPPTPQNYFNDYAGVVSRNTAQQLNNELRQFERESSNQIVVAVFPKMNTESSIADFSQRIFHSWKVGQAKLNNGAVLFVFVQDHQMRIQTGYGLEGALPDILCKQIIENEIVPRFKNRDFDGGLSAGVNAMIKATRGEYKGNGHIHGEPTASHGPTILVIIILLIIVFKILQGLWGWWRGGTVYSSRRSYWGDGGWGGGWGGGGWGSGGGGGFGGGDGGGFSGGGGDSGGGGASGSW